MLTRYFSMCCCCYTHSCQNPCCQSTTVPLVVTHTRQLCMWLQGMVVGSLQRNFSPPPRLLLVPVTHPGPHCCYASNSRTRKLLPSLLLTVHIAPGAACFPATAAVNACHVAQLNCNCTRNFQHQKWRLQKPLLVLLLLLLGAPCARTHCALPPLQTSWRSLCQGPCSPERYAMNIQLQYIHQQTVSWSAFLKEKPAN